ncbi:glycosyltransferase family 4 protein [Candidatus Sumerlaeota bacterium]|nr:glycosyltransferase family 4 protein [Candidatus Sumerlaeota bacterium]
MKISIISHNLSENCLGRAYILGKAISKFAEVEIIGTQFGPNIWEPVDTGEFSYKSIKCRSELFNPKVFSRVCKLITGDVIYAVKPRPTSYLSALLAKIKTHKPLILDIDDWEIGFHLADGYLRFFVWTVLNAYLINGQLLTAITSTLTRCADYITVSSKFLQKKFGGTIVPHGRDTDEFNPSKFNGDKIRQEFNLGDKKIIMFLGTPRAHKGLEDIISAIKKLNRQDVQFVIVGAGSEPNYEALLLKNAGNILTLIPKQPFPRIPEFLSVADVVVLPQKKSPTVYAQIPAKLFDAMAMATPIIATAVSDLPQILDNCGIIVPPDDIEALAKNINFILDNPQVAQDLGNKARQKCIKYYSLNTMSNILKTIINQLVPTKAVT